MQGTIFCGSMSGGADRAVLAVEMGGGGRGPGRTAPLNLMLLDTSSICFHLSGAALTQTICFPLCRSSVRRSANFTFVIIITFQRIYTSKHFRQETYENRANNREYSRGQSGF